MYRVLFIDADDTLLDFRKTEHAAFSGSFEKYGYSGDYENLKEEYRLINGKIWEQVEKGEISTGQVNRLRFSRLFDTLSIDFPKDEFSDYYLSLLSEGCYMIDGAEEICGYLAERYRIVIVTNGIDRVQRSRFECSRIGKYVSEIVTSEEAGVNKPDRKIFDYALEKAGIDDRSEILMIGDSFSSDICGGINAGIDTCWYNPGRKEIEDERKPKYEISSLQELRDFL